MLNTQVQIASPSTSRVAIWTDRDERDLEDAAERLVHAQTMAMNTTAWLSRHLLSAAGSLDGIGHQAFGMVWDRVEARAQGAVEAALRKAVGIANKTVRVRRQDNSLAWINRLLASVSGTVSGFIGLPGLLLDIPVTTMAILRAIAAVAREHGEDPAAEDTKRACLEVLAHGGPQGGSEDGDDEMEIGYWSARAGLSHLTIAALIRTVAARFGVTLSSKLLAQAVPIAGAVAGGGLNWVFMGYYQEMAHVHFTIRAIERRSGDASGVRDRFDRLVAAARARRRSGAPDRTING